jgi:hypothetical protein
MIISIERKIFDKNITSFNVYKTLYKTEIKSLFNLAEGGKTHSHAEW